MVMPEAGLYRTIWRWHFYAGLFVMPFVLVLSLSGSLYLFRPQVERWEERAFQTQSAASAVKPHEQLEAALGAHPDARFLDYRVPGADGDAAMIRLALPDGEVLQVFVSPGGSVLGALDPDTRIMAVTKRIHSELLIGTAGNRLVELAASWAIVMILTGLYLWWPRGRGPAGVLWPRLRSGGRAFWRDLHAVTGVWASTLALGLLVSGLPWAGVWGAAFGALRAEMGWVSGPAQWDIDGSKPAIQPAAHAHDHGSTEAAPTPDAPFSARVFDQMVVDVRNEGLAFPAIVTPPGSPGRFDAPGQMLWTIRSDIQNPPLRTTIRYDLTGRHEIARERFEDTHPIDRVINYGIAWHEGQLFGWINQLIGLLTAAMLVTLAVSAFAMWRRRKPAGRLGAPPPGAPGAARGLLGIVLVLALLLPLLALSLAAIFVLERLVLARIPATSRWLGLGQA